MVDDVTINGLRKNETYPGLDDLIHDVKCKFGIKDKLDIDIVDDASSGPNMNVESKFRWKKDPNTLNTVLKISRGMFNIINFVENPDEMKSLIAHEVSHIKNEDDSISKKIIIIYAVLAIISAGIVMIASTCNLFLIFLDLVLIGICGARNFNWKRRKMETRADTDAVIKIGNPHAFQVALKKIYIVEKDDPHYLKFAALLSVYNFIVGFSYPSIAERINNIEMWKPPR
ncbi:M48 family metallopeptidase [Methanoregula sp.]|uniref:M48 family metallopeptidase n=1 Tax=Methanoregula sp. TaxID=2052170 RepID=UPI003C777CA3